MVLTDLLARITAFGDAPALFSNAHNPLRYRDLAAAIVGFGTLIDTWGLEPGTVVSVATEFNAECIAFLLAAWSRGVVTALAPPGAADAPALMDATLATAVVDPRHPPQSLRVGPQRPHPLLDAARNAGSGGFVIMTSGSSGSPKAALHATDRFLHKYRGDGKPLRTLGFLSLDHVAGVDTLLYTLSAGGALVVPDARDPEPVCRCIARWGVEVLPVSPSFIRLLLLSGALARHDLASLKIITYGSEPMDEATLGRLREALPRVRVIQKYGTTEFGAPRARSRADTSTWIHIKSDETEYRIVDGRLWVRSPCSMLGYLNAATPIDADGWLDTGDLVEVDGDWIRVIGRDADVINVGGEKVMPSEVESVIESFGGVLEALVRADPHPVMGHVPHAVVRMGSKPESPREVRAAIRRHCRARLPRHKVPARISFATEPLHSERHKKQRSRQA